MMISIDMLAILGVITGIIGPIVALLVMAVS
jgi:hypothetical protein